MGFQITRLWKHLLFVAAACFAAILAGSMLFPLPRSGKPLPIIAGSRFAAIWPFTAPKKTASAEAVRSALYFADVRGFRFGVTELSRTGHVLRIDYQLLRTGAPTNICFQILRTYARVEFWNSSQNRVCDRLQLLPLDDGLYDQKSNVCTGRLKLEIPAPAVAFSVAVDGLPEMDTGPIPIPKDDEEAGKGLPDEEKKVSGAN